MWQRRWRCVELRLILSTTALVIMGSTEATTRPPIRRDIVCNANLASGLSPLYRRVDEVIIRPVTLDKVYMCVPSSSATNIWLRVAPAC